ncbi:forkhead box protein A2-like [Stegodyphus dumicola]|uniref:forkhead box protein A2-like n=1 Tax=Stegodyphus dumicola TaxID=202533 RepID=UPI0015A933BE|nr:forkhead box protein A2-like [Stegodyphus dumicola]XP_035209713.1 forkhead box protein A2-like [Stegodyphus dumicola]
MKSCWAVLLLLVILQNLALSALGGHHHHGNSNLAHILAAGLIVQLLASAGKHKHHHHHGHHHEHEARHNEIGYGHEEALPYHGQEWNNPSDGGLQTQPSFATGSWARTPLDLAYARSRFEEPLLESYNVPYFYPPPSGMWRLH